jgi:hypothetical protein
MTDGVIGFSFEERVNPEKWLAAELFHDGRA